MGERERLEGERNLSDGRKGRSMESIWQDDEKSSERFSCNDVTLGAGEGVTRDTKSCGNVFF